MCIGELPTDFLVEVEYDFKSTPALLGELVACSIDLSEYEFIVLLFNRNYRYDNVYDWDIAV